MSEPKFTPEPWQVVYSAGFYVVTTTPEEPWKGIIATVHGNGVLANAKLISIAQQLLKAVETLVHDQCQITCRDWEKECSPDCWVLEYKKLIAESKGEEL